MSLKTNTQRIKVNSTPQSHQEHINNCFMGNMLKIKSTRLFREFERRSSRISEKSLMCRYCVSLLNPSDIGIIKPNFKSIHHQISYLCNTSLAKISNIELHRNPKSNIVIAKGRFMQRANRMQFFHFSSGAGSKYIKGCFRAKPGSRAYASFQSSNSENSSRKFKGLFVNYSKQSKIEEYSDMSFKKISNESLRQSKSFELNEREHVALIRDALSHKNPPKLMRNSYKITKFLTNTNTTLLSNDTHDRSSVRLCSLNNFNQSLPNNESPEVVAALNEIKEIGIMIKSDNNEKIITDTKQMRNITNTKISNMKLSDTLINQHYTVISKIEVMLRVILNQDYPKEINDDKEIDEIYNIDNVFLVENIEKAEIAMKKLYEISDMDPQRIFACDTEVRDIDLKQESPVGHGKVICFSIYCGEDIDFGNGKDKLSHLWVDTLGKGEASDTGIKILNIFREFFENERFLKVWHNYGFDRHVLENMGINCRGFGGDTMHMARLWDSCRRLTGYSLEALSTAKELYGDINENKKTSMKDLFGRPKSKRDGTPGKLIMIPPVEEIQLSKYRKKWIHYSARDAKATYDLRLRLKEHLKFEKGNIIEISKCMMDASLAKCYPHIKSLWDFYKEFWLPFGELLTDIEREGVLVDVDHLAKAEIEAKRDRDGAANRFKQWADDCIKGAKYMNVNSDSQIRTILFAGIGNKKDPSKKVEMSRNIKVPNPEYEIHIAKNCTGRAPKKMIDVELHGLWGKGKECPLKPEIYTSSGWPAVSASALKTLIGKPGVAKNILKEQFGIELGKDLYQYISDANLLPDGDDCFSDEIDDSYNSAFLTKMISNKNGLGQLYEASGGGKKGLLACAAVESLLEVNAIDTLLSSFIIPLQQDNVKTRDGRIHASLNINTETGRLSCRRPNLQNQPAFEKDRYKVRHAFKADISKGKTLIVADYGQLELRVLAHLTNCSSMLYAFEQGGDFHSRTAVGMYDYIREAIERGECILEKGISEESKPLIKDIFAAERRKAKVLNFSIAYGKTVHGLSKDWKVSLKEADDTLRRWYSDRSEVKIWQEKTIREGEMQGYITTLLGRRRYLPDLRSKDKAHRAHAQRAAINTPIQGSAADIVTAAMLSINSNKRLKDLGWKLISQVHDEVILEGPEKSAKESKDIVVQCMKKPFSDGKGGYTNPLRVDLAIDCKYAHSWYEAK